MPEIPNQDLDIPTPGQDLDLPPVVLPLPDPEGGGEIEYPSPDLGGGELPPGFIDLPSPDLGSGEGIGGLLPELPGKPDNEKPSQGGNGSGDNDSSISDDGSIDGIVIDDDVSDSNTLRSVLITPQPQNSYFENISKVSKRNKSISGTKRIDKLTGKGGGDKILGKQNNDYIYGEGGNDKLSGGTGNDVLNGGDGKDKLLGGKGDDVIYGGNGSDKLTGNSGDDLFILSEGKDVIKDFNIKQDTLGLVYALDLTFTQKGNDLIVKGSDGVNTRLLNIEKDDFLSAYPNNLSIVPITEVNLLTQRSET